MENTTPTPPMLPEATGVKKEKYIISIIIFILAVAVAYLAWYVNGGTKISEKEVSSFDECVQAGYPVAESYPRQCHVPNGGSFVETLPVEEEGNAAPLEAEASLGGDIYKQAEDPIKDKIPEGVAPVSNPIGGAYKNPFQ